MSNTKIPPVGDFGNKILNTLGSLDNFRKLFKESTLKGKGSGYTYLVLNKNDNLEIINILNQDYSYFHKQILLLCLDLWEYAYYINYENKRDLYIDNFFEIIDFEFANKTYNTIINRENTI